MATLFNGSLTIQGIFDATNTLGKADTSSDTIFSVLNNVSYSSNQRVMMEIGASNTNVGNYNSFYKYSLGYSNTANGPGGSFVIQGCPISTNTYNGVNPPRTLMAMNEKSAQIVPSVVLGNNSLGPIYVATYAGTGVPGNTNGPAVSASFSSPLGVCIDTSGNMFVSDYTNNLIRKITPDGIVTTLAGSGSVGSANGIGSNASFNRPLDVKVDNSGNVFVGDRDNHRIRRVNTVTGVVDTFSGVDAGFIDGIQGARFNGPHGLSFDTSGNLFVADSYNHSIRQINLDTKIVTTLAGTSSAGFVNAAASSARFNSPYGLLADTSGNVFVADSLNNLVRKINIGSRMVTTLAGNASGGYADGIGANPSFSYPWGLTTDNSGNIFVVNRAIRKITPDGNVKTIVGTVLPKFTGAVDSALLDGNSSDACFSGPSDIALDNNGNMFVADLFNNCIRKVDSNGVVSTLAGNKLQGSADGIGSGNAPSFNSPFGVTVDTSGNIFIVDFENNRIRKIAPDGVVSTLAGSGKAGFADGTGANASFYAPNDITSDTSGNLFVADSYNQRIRKIVISTGVVTTIAGNGVYGYVDGAGISASFKNPYGIGIDRSGNLFIADTDNHRIRKIIISTGVVSTVAGSGSVGSVNATSTSASFYYPYGVAADISGNLFVADCWNHVIRKIVLSSGVVSTLAGNVVGGFADGSATVARFTYPYGVAVDTAGNVYVADKQNGRIRKVTSAGVVSSIAGNSQQSWVDGVGSNASFYFPSKLALDTDGNLIVTDWYNHKIRKVTLSGVVTTLAGNVRGFADGVSTGSIPSFFFPSGIAIDTSGNIIVADQQNHRIRKVTPNGVVTTIAGSGAASFINGTGSSATFNVPYGVAVDNSGNIFVADNYNHSIRKITADGVVTTLAGGGSTTPGIGGGAFLNGTGTSASFSGPSGVIVDTNGNLFVADTVNNRIRKIVISTGIVTTLAGSGSSAFADGTGTSASFWWPHAFALDTNGNLFVTDTLNNRIRTIVISTGAVTTIAGSTQGFSDGTGAGALFYRPTGIAIDSSGNLIVTDQFNHRIRKISFPNGLIPNGGVVTTIAGGGNASFTDGIGAAASFRFPSGVAIDTSGNIIIGDQQNNRIRKITPSGLVTTVAGDGYGAPTSSGRWVDGTAPLGASFYSPRGVVIDTSGNLFVADTGNHIIRKIVISTGEVTTIAGSGNGAFADGIGGAASFNSPTKLAIDTSGNLFVADSSNHRIRKIVISTGAVSTVAGSGNAAFADAPSGPGAAASFNVPFDVDIDENGILYVAELYNHRIRKIVISTGVVTTLAGGNGTTPGVGGGRWLDGTGTGAAFNQPIAVSLDKRGNLIVSDHANHRIRKIALATGVVTTIAGQDTPGFDDGLSPGALFYRPSALTLDTSGNLYVTDRDNHRIRKIVISTGVVTTVAGTGQFTPLKNTIGVSSTFYYPLYLAIDRSGNIFVADQLNNVIRKLYNYDVGNFSLYTSGDVFTDSSLYAKNIVATNSMEVAGNLTIGGHTTFKTDRWNGSSDGALRLYFGNNSSTYYQTRDKHVFRSASNSGPPYGERDLVTIDGNWSGQGSLALSCAAGNRGVYTHYYAQENNGAVTQDSYQLWWYPGRGQGGLGGSGLYNNVWDLNAAQNYWNVYIPMNLGKGLSIAGAVLSDGTGTYNLSIPGGTNQRMGNLTLNSIQATGNIAAASMRANEFLIGKDYEYSGTPGAFSEVGSYSLFRGAFRNIPTADLGSLRGGNAGGWIALSGYAPPVKSAIYLVYVTRSLPGAGRGYSTHLLQTWDTGGTNRQGNKNNWESTRLTDANNGYWDDYVYIIDYWGNWANLGDGYIASRGNNSTNDILIVQLA